MFGSLISGCSRPLIIVCPQITERAFFMERTNTMKDLSGKNILKSSITFSRDVGQIIFASRKLIEAGHIKAAEFLLKEAYCTLYHAKEAFIAADATRWSGHWVKVPQRLREAVKQYISGDNVMSYMAQVLDNLPETIESRDLAELLTSAIRATPKSEQQAEKSRVEWREYLGTRQVIVAKLAKFGMTAGSILTPTFLLDHPTIHNGSVIPVDHIWLQPMDLTDFEQLRLGDMIAFNGEVYTYDEGEKVGIREIADLQILDMGDGKAFCNTRYGKLWKTRGLKRA